MTSRNTVSPHSLCWFHYYQKHEHTLLNRAATTSWIQLETLLVSVVRMFMHKIEISTLNLKRQMTHKSTWTFRYAGGASHSPCHVGTCVCVHYDLNEYPAVVQRVTLWLEKSHWLFPCELGSVCVCVCVCSTMLPRCIIMQVGEPRGDYVLNCINFFFRPFLTDLALFNERQHAAAAARHYAPFLMS